MRLFTQQPTNVTDYSHRCWADCDSWRFAAIRGDSRRFAAIRGDLLISDTRFNRVTKYFIFPTVVNIQGEGLGNNTSRLLASHNYNTPTQPVGMGLLYQLVSYLSGWTPHVY